MAILHNLCIKRTIVSLSVSGFDMVNGKQIEHNHQALHSLVIGIFHTGPNNSKHLVLVV